MVGVAYWMRYLHRPIDALVFPFEEVVWSIIYDFDCHFCSEYFGVFDGACLIVVNGFASVWSEDFAAQA